MLGMASSDEKQGLTQSFKSQMGYGTAVNAASSKKSVPKTRKLISKKVSKSDTLIGIALKYGVTVQDLKRENRLWTNDSLFLRESLLIPLTPDNQNSLDPGDIIVFSDGTQSHGSSGDGKDNNHSYNNAMSSVLPGDDPYSGNEPATLSTSSSSFLEHSRSSSSSSALSSTFSPSTSAPISPSASCQFYPSKVNHTGIDGNGSNRNTSQSSSLTTSSSGIHSSGDGQPDFFSKYDLNIARLKGNVARMESNASTSSSTSRHGATPSSSSSPSPSSSSSSQKKNGGRHRRSLHLTTSTSSPSPKALRIFVPKSLSSSTSSSFPTSAISSPSSNGSTSPGGDYCACVVENETSC